MTIDVMTGAGAGAFDAALKALEDLETDVARQKDGGQKAPVAMGGLNIGPSIGLDDDASEPIDGAAPVLAPVLAPADPVPAAAPAVPDFDDLEQAVAASLAQAEAEPVVPLASDDAAAKADAAPAPSARMAKLPMAMAGVALFASLLSGIGLVVASRTVAGASLVVADARERQQQMIKVGALVHDLEIIRTRQLELLKIQQAAVTSAPVTADQMHASMDSLRMDMGKTDADMQMLRTVQDGQNELNDVLTTLGTKISRIEDRLSASR